MIVKTLKIDTILYVEDDLAINDAMQGFLSRFCKKLLVAYNGEEGLHLYKEHRPEIIVSDIKMPKMNGIEMVRAIKEIDSEQTVIFTSAHSESSYLIDSIECHVDGYILKPIDLEILRKKLESIISQKLLVEELEEKKSLLILQEKQLALSELIGNLAHHWRQPLSTISIAASGMRMKQDSDALSAEDVITYTDMIVKNTTHLSKTLDILDGFIEDNRELKTVHLDEYIQRIADFVEETLLDNNIDFEVENNLESFELCLPTGYLTQSIMCITNNAQDAIKENNISEPWIKLTVDKKDDNILITVEDNGGGIPDAIISKVFDPYFTTKHQAQGTGLGLSTTYRLITEYLEGKIYVKNIDNGAKFFIEIPIN